MDKMTNLKNLGLRVYNNKMVIEKNVEGVEVNKDLTDLQAICNKTFGYGTPSPENLHMFNQLLVQTADEIAEPRVEAILGLLAEYESVPAGTVKVLEMPKTVKPKFSFTAKGTGVDLERIDGSVTRKVATPQSLTYGATYELTTFMADPVKAFNDAVDKLADAKVEFYFEKVMEVLKTAVANAEIPANNVKSGSSLTLVDFKKLENNMIRLTNGRPLFIADSALINHFADQVVTAQKDLLTDELRDMLREELVPSKISKTIALPFPNQWIDEKNSKVKFDVQTGFVFPGSYSGKKPFAITEFGTKRQYSTIDAELERVNLKIVFECDITLLNGRYVGAVVDDSITI